MAKTYFPAKNKVYIQNNRSNVYPEGNLWSTFGIDLQSNVGVLRISPRMKVNTSTADSASLGCPVAFKTFQNKIWAICDTHIFTNSGLPGSSPFTDDATTGFQTDYNADESDLELFNGTLCATSTDGLFSTDGSNWTQRDVLSTGSNHVLAYFKRFNRLYYANLINQIISIDSTWATADPGSDYAINLSPNTSSQYTITCMKSTSTAMWIGVLDNLSPGLPGKVCMWDGISAAISQEYDLNNAQGAMAIAIDPEHDTPYVMDSNGVLSAFNGSGFSEVGRLPFPFSRLPYNIGDTDNESFIHPNGMYFTKNGTLRVLINNRAASSSDQVVENMPSGVWEWSKDNGFVHIQAFSYNPASSSTITDFGQNRIARVGALASLNVPSTSTSDGTFLAGAVLYTNASSTTSAICFDNSLDTVQKKGYFVTDWFESDEIADKWNRLWISFRRFLDSNDKIVFKYRHYEESPVSADITWVNTTSFTTATDITAYGPTASGFNGTTGGEVEILRGTGGATCSHITNITGPSGGLYTVTLDEIITGVTTGTATARFQKWLKLNPSEPMGQVTSWADFGINAQNADAARIQIKGCFTFTGVGEFYKSAIVSNPDIKINP